MKLTKIKKGTYKGQYEDEIGVIYNEELARLKFPDSFKSSPKTKGKKRTKPWLS